MFVRTFTVQESRLERTGIRRENLSALVLYVSARKRYCRAHDIKGNNRENADCSGIVKVPVTSIPHRISSRSLYDYGDKEVWRNKKTARNALRRES